MLDFILAFFFPHWYMYTFVPYGSPPICLYLKDVIFMTICNFHFIHFLKTFYIILSNFFIFKFLSCSHSLCRAPLDSSQWLIILLCLINVDLTWAINPDKPALVSQSKSRKLRTHQSCVVLKYCIILCIPLSSFSCYSW